MNVSIHRVSKEVFEKLKKGSTDENKRESIITDGVFYRKMKCGTESVSVSTNGCEITFFRGDE